MAIPSEALKTCSECRETKPIAEYYIRSNGRPHGNCKICYRAKVKARKTGPRRAEVLAMDNAALKIKRREVRDVVFNAYGGYRCVCCGETEPSFLTLDHINNDGGEFRKRELGTRTAAGFHTYRWLIRNGFPPGVQVLCMNCQHSKLLNKGVCAHQRTSNDYAARQYAQAGGSAAPLN